MRNRSAIWVFTVLLFLACLYQLSFSWVTKSFESDIRDLAETKYDSIANEAIEFTINDDTLIIGSDKETTNYFLLRTTTSCRKSGSTNLSYYRFRLPKV